MKKQILCLIFLAVSLFLLFSNLSPLHAASPINVTFQRTYQSSQPIVSRPGLFDYEPSAMLDSDGKWKIWYCGQLPGYTGSLSADTVYLATLSPGGSDNSPIPVFPETCGPTVVKHSTPSINNGAEMYSMYGECWGITGSSAAGICHAISPDGIHWQTLKDDGTFGDSNVSRKGIIPYSQKTIDACNMRIENNRWVGDFLSGDSCPFYGIGHPTAIVKTVDGKQQIWLWYYDDTRRAENPALVYLTKSFDGINFGTPVPTNMTRKPFNVIYVDIPVGNYPGYYLGTTNFPDPATGKEGLAIFTYSVDGINWTSPENTDTNLLRIGQASNSLAAAGPNAIVSDPYGVVHSSSMDYISAEGLRESTPTTWFASTWDFWYIKGIFTALPSCPTGQTCNITRAEGAKILSDQFAFPSASPSVPTFADVAKNSPYYQAVEIFWANKITSGCSVNPRLFCPESPMTRGEAATFLLRIAKYSPDPNDTTPRFADVPQSHPLFAYIQLFGKLGLTVGCSQNPAKFCPNDPIKGDDLNVFIARVKSLMSRPGDFNHDNKVSIDDYTFLQANFGNPYTIFDFNLIIENFGK